MKYSCVLLLSILLLACPLFSQEKALVLNVEEHIINPVIYEYISQGIQKAEKENMHMVIIKLDTPGGILESTRKIVKEILNSTVPVVVYVSPEGARAASAGVFITLSAHVAAMSPSTHIGAAHPVMMNNSWGQVDEELKEKIINDTLSWVENIANTRNRNARWAKKAVLESVSVDENQALEENVIDYVAGDLKELLEKIDKREIVLGPDKTVQLNTEDIILVDFDMNLRQNILNTIINPQIAYLLMLLGFFALLYEVTHPGFGFPGIFGIISLILAFYAFQVLPVNYAGVALIVLGILFLIIELFTPTFGMFTLGGIICMVIGSLMLFNQDVPFLKISLKLVLGVVLSLSIITLFLLTKVVAIQRRKPLAGKEALIGKTGVAITDIKKKGQIELEGQIWTAKSKDDIKKGEEVITEKIEGLTLYVKKKEVDDVS